MKHLGKYEEFNLDLRRMLIAGMRKRGHSVGSIAEATALCEEEISQIILWPVTVPACNFAAVVSLLGVVGEFYDAFLREAGRDRERGRPLH